jgi:hypothetical protein
MRSMLPSPRDSSKAAIHLLRGWLERRWPAWFQTARSPELRTPVAPAPPPVKNELAQFPGLDFRAHHIDLDNRAADNEAAIRASFIYFKHRWPGQVAEIEGPDAFRRTAWRIAQEVGVRIKGGVPRPSSGQVISR